MSRDRHSFSFRGVTWVTRQAGQAKNKQTNETAQRARRRTHTRQTDTRQTNEDKRKRTNQEKGQTSERSRMPSLRARPGRPPRSKYGAPYPSLRARLSVT
eukprot:4943756-Prymnesium_polylepis.1